MAWRKTLLLDVATVVRQHARQLSRSASSALSSSQRDRLSTCCSDELSVAAAAQLRVAVKNGDVDYSVLQKVDRGSDTSTGSSTLFGVYKSFTQATVDVTSGAGSHNFLH